MINKCIVLGDFNVDMESHPERVELYNQNQKVKHQRMLNEEDIELEIEEEKKEENHEHDFVLSQKMAKNEDMMSQDLVSKEHNEYTHKIDADIEDELGDDILTQLSCQGKESLADNLRKLKMARSGGKKTKFTKKAYINIPHHLGASFRKLNRYEPTFKRAEYNIDHIFANFECRDIKNHLLALGRYKLSDHRLVVSEFTAV